MNLGDYRELLRQSPFYVHNRFNSNENVRFPSMHIENNKTQSHNH